MRISLATPMRQAKTLFAALGVPAVPQGTPLAAIGGIATDSREVLAGDLFVALVGARQNGNDHIAAALQKGAVAVLTDAAGTPPVGNYWWLQADSAVAALLAAAHAWRRRARARVVAVGGSTGKTTVKELVATVLGEVAIVRKSAGNYNSMLGMPLSLLAMEEADYFVLEVGINHVGEMEALSRALAPDLAILTNVGSAHIGQFASSSELLSEKLKLAAGLGHHGVLFVADTVPHSAWQTLGCRVFAVGTGEHADFRAIHPVHGKEGVWADVRFGTRTVQALHWHMPGSIGTSCLAFGAAVGLYFGLDNDSIRRGLARAVQSAPRMQRLEIMGRTIIDDTYNASPEAVVAALEALCYLGEGRPLAAVLGDIGELGAHAAALHRAAGECAGHSGLAHLFTYGDYAHDLAYGAAVGGMCKAQIHTFAKGCEGELAAAVRALVPQGGMVLFKASRKTALDRVIKELGRGL